MKTIREVVAIWLRKLADKIQPSGGGGGPKEPL
jgi:hypothetical protein